MSVPYIPKITTGGQNAAITARENGFAFEVTHVSFGTGLYVHTGNEIALQNEIAKVPIAGGGRVAGMLSLVINALLKDSDLYVGVNQPVDISEIGFWNEGVLFAIYANNTVLVRKIENTSCACVYTLALRTLQPEDAANITVVVDETESIALAVLGEHEAAPNPHQQYATVLALNAEAEAREDGDEELQNSKADKNGDAANSFKVALAVDPEDAVRKSQLDDIQSALNTETEVREDGFKRAGLIGNLYENDRYLAPDANLNVFFTENGKWHFSSTQHNRPFDNGILEVVLIKDNACIQDAVSYLGKRAIRYFLIYDGSYQWTDWVYTANGKGDNTLRFKVANAESDDEAVSKEQLDDEAETRYNGLRALGLGILETLDDDNRYIESPSFDDYQTTGRWAFSGAMVASGAPFSSGILDVQEVTTFRPGVRIIQIVTDTSNSGGLGNNYFSATRYYYDNGAITNWTNWWYSARANGHPSNRFKVANAESDDEAVSKEQLDETATEIKKNVVNSIFGGIGFSSYGVGLHTRTIPAGETVRVILIGGGGGGGAINSPLLPTADGKDGQSTTVALDLSLVLTASGGLGGKGANGSGASYTGANGLGGEAILNNFVKAVILSYGNGMEGSFIDDTPIIKHPTVKHFELDGLGKGGEGIIKIVGSDVYKAGGGGSGSIIEAVVRNTDPDNPTILYITVGAGGNCGSGNIDSGDDGVDGRCVVIHTYFS